MLLLWQLDLTRLLAQSLIKVELLGLHLCRTMGLLWRGLRGLGSLLNEVTLTLRASDIRVAEVLDLGHGSEFVVASVAEEALASKSVLGLH